MRLLRPRMMNLYVLLAVIFMLSLYGGGSAWAEESAVPELNLAADRQSYPLNDTIKITVLAHGVNDLYAVKWDLSYDEQYVAYFDGSAQSAAWPSGYTRTKAAPGLIRLVSSKLGAAAGDSGTFALVTLQFKPLKQGDTMIRLNQLSASDSSLQLLSLAEPGGLRLRITPPDTKPPADVNHAQSKETHNLVTLTWDDPKDEDLTEVRVYLNGELRATVEKGDERADIAGLAPKTDYRFVIKTVDHVGNESAGVTVKAKTKNDSRGKDDSDSEMDTDSDMESSSE